MSLFTTLTASGARFVLIGGLAVVMHGVDRSTADVDIVLDLTADSAMAAIKALTTTGYRPMAPVNAADFADVAIRARWQRERQMQVFSLWDSQNQRPTVDVLVESVVPFDELWRDAVSMALRDATVKVASIAHLIRLKEHAGRPQDLADIARLRQIAETPQRP